MKMASDINFCQEQATWKKSYPSATQLFLFVCMHTRVHVHVWVHVWVSVGGSGSQGTTPEVILKAWTPCFWDGGIIIVEFAKARLASQWVSGLHLLLLPQQWDYKRVASCYLGSGGGIQVLMLIQHTFYWLSYLPNSLLFKKDGVLGSTPEVCIKCFGWWG